MIDHTKPRRSSDFPRIMCEMTSREIVRRAIDGTRPRRMPVTMPSLGVSDVGGITVKPAPDFAPDIPGMDEWHCVWDKTETENMGQVTGHPLESLDDLASFQPPSFHQDERYEDCEEQLCRLESADKYIRCGIFMVLFERMHSLHGFENTLVDLYADRERLERLADRIVETQISLVREVSRRFPGRIHGWGMSDDWGTQQAAFISRDLWMDFFFPRYKRIFDAMHDAGCDVWVHSCGKINEIIECYIQAGVNVVNLQQPRALGIEEIGNRYRGRIAFESLADIQSTLPSGDVAAIEADVEALCRHWASPEGGFIFSDYGDGNAIGVADPGVKQTMYNAFSRWSERLYGIELPRVNEEDQPGVR